MEEEKIIEISKISPKNLVTIPKEVIELLDLKRGDKILWFQKNDLMCIRKI